MKRQLKTIPLLVALTGATAVASTAISSIEPTATQAIVRTTTDQQGPCTYRASENAGFADLVHDIDPALFLQSNKDSRTGSFGDDSYHVFVLGRRDAERAVNGRRYSRALRANTTHWIGVTCGGDPEVVQSFLTRNPPLGQSFPETPPFDTNGFGNYAWPSIDFSDQSQTYIDPMTGIALKRITAPGWNSKDYANNSFSNVFDLNSAWTNAGNAGIWPGTANQLSTYSGSASDPLFAAIDLSTLQDYGFGSLAISGWAPSSAMDDVLVRTFGFGSQASPGDRTVLVCLSLDSGNTCSTQELPVILPMGSAGNGPTAPAAGYPRPAWTSWAATPPFAGRDFGTVITVVTASGHTITNAGTQSSQYFSRGWKTGGKVLVNGTEVYTIAQVVNGSTITTLETVVAHATAVAFKSLCAGVRIRKQSGTGSVSLAAGFDFSVSSEFNMPFTGVRNLCSQLTVNVTRDASGQPAPARAARLCAIPNTGGHALFAFFSDNGESRLLSNFQATGGYTFHPPDWQQYDGNNPTRTSYTTSDVWDPAVPTRFYTSMQLGTHYSLVRVEYSGNFAAYNPFPATRGANPGGLWADDQLTYTIVGGYPSEGKGIDQQVAQLGNPYFDGSQWKVWSFTGLLPGGVATWQANTACCNENPTFFAFQDVNTGAVTKLIDTIANYPMRFWGNHSTQILNGYYISIANILGSKGTTTDNYLGGPFILFPTQIQQNGVWNANTALTATYADMCPDNIDPRWQKFGATGRNCILMQAKQPCSSFASATEAAKFPCPWDGTKSMVTPLAPGDRFWLDYPPSPGSAETMRVVTPPVDLGGGAASFWALRHSERYANLGGAYGAYSEAHANGWIAAMIPPEARSNAAAEIAPDGTVYSEHSSLPSTHSAIGPGLLSANSTAIISGIDTITGFPLPYYYGVRWNKPLTVQAGQLPDYNLYQNGRFGGKDNSGAAMENYPSMQQIQAGPNEKRWFLDLHHLNPNFGTGQEVYAGIGAIVAARVPGATNVYRFTSYPGSNTDIKRFAPAAYAGPYLLKDISGSASAISDSTPWSFCFAYRGGECQIGSAAGQIYTSVPQMDTRGVGDGQCIAGWYAQVNPCALIPSSSAAWGMQYDASRRPVDDNYWRKLTQGFSGIGRQYQFGNLTPEPDGRWAFMQCYWCDGVRNEVFGIQLPAFPGYDTVNHADFVSVPVQVPPGFGVNARVRFGYAENGPPSSFFCSTRQEACLTDTATRPFAYERSDTLKAASCPNGCSFNIPGISGRVLYYRIERLGSNGELVSADPMTATTVP